MLSSSAAAALRATSNRTVARQASRSLSSQPPLNVEFPGTPPTDGIPLTKPATQVTTLSNGLRVASEETGQMSTSVSLMVDAGSRYETDHNNGISSFLAHMAFKSTEDRSHLRMVRDLEEIGGTAGADSARDYIQYTTDVLRPHTERAVEMIAETVMKPKLAPWDIEAQVKVVEFEIADLAKDPSHVIFESIHEAAYTDSSALGRPKVCPQRNLNKLTADNLRAFTDGHYSAKRMVLAGAGVDHAEFVAMAEKLFGDLPANVPSGVEPVVEKCKYVGGERRVRDDSPLAHVALAFDGGSWHSSDLFPVCVLNMLLGGGGSFSAGGPGKGMYSRLYTNVLNQHGWVESASAFNSMFSDAGIIGIYGACEASSAGRFVDVIAAELIALASQAPGAEETERAKNQLLSAVLSSLDSRTHVCEDIGRQVLTYGARKSVETLVAEIGAVTPEAIQNAAKSALASPVSMAAYGDVSALPSLEAISNKFK